jgi:hypothetical protein
MTDAVANTEKLEGILASLTVNRYAGSQMDNTAVSSFIESDCLRTEKVDTGTVRRFLCRIRGGPATASCGNFLAVG